MINSSEILISPSGIPYMSRRKAPLDEGLQVVRETVRQAISSDKNSEKALNPKLLEEAALEWFLALTRWVLRSDPGTPKSEKLLKLLGELEFPGGITGKQLVGKVIYDKENPSEDGYHDLLNGNPMHIAVFKASASHTLDTPKRAERARALKRYAQQFDCMSEGEEFPTGGLLTVFRATDIMTTIKKNGKSVGLFKPPTAVRLEMDRGKQKAQTYHHAISKFGAANEKERKRIEIACVAAEAQYEGVTNRGVVHEAKINITMSMPTQAYWYCYFWGTKSVPPAFQKMATRFDNIYAETIKQGRQDLLRGWTPSEGSVGAQNVNGGWQTDIIFARKLLYKSVQDGDKGEIVERGNPQFDKIADKAAFLWRGEPLLFQDVLRDLVELIYRESLGAELPDNPFDTELNELRETIRSHYQWKVPFDAERIADGVWFGGPAPTVPRTPTSLDAMKGLLEPSFERKMSKHSRWPAKIRRRQ